MKRTSWSEMTWPEIEEASRSDTMVLVPMGSMEQHGPHLPLDTDSEIASRVVQKVVERLSRRREALIFPPIRFTYSLHHMSFPGTISLSSDTLINVVVEICSCIIQHGFKKIAIINTHGGNSSLLRMAVDRIKNRLGVSPVVVDCWPFLKNSEKGRRCIDEVCEECPPLIGGHAGEFETSLRLAMLPHDIDGQLCNKMNEVSYKNLPEGVFARKNFKSLTEAGYIGSPHLASSKKGKKLIECLVHELANFLETFFVSRKVDSAKE